MKLTARRALATAITTLLLFGAAGVAPATAATTPPTLVSNQPAAPYEFTEYNGLLYLAAIAEGDIYSTLFSFDGTTFTSIPGSPTGIGEMSVYNGELIIESADDLNDPPYDYVMFTYDGSSFSQVPGLFVSPNNFVEAGGTLFFQASVADVWSVWQYDGTAASTVAGSAVEPNSLSEFGGKLYFNGDTDPSPAEVETLFSYDPAGASPAAPVPGAPVGPGELVAFDGAAFLGADGGLYSFDGVSTFTAIPSSLTGADALTTFDGGLYFTGDSGSDSLPYVYASGAITPVPGGVITETVDYFAYKDGLYFLGFADLASPPVLSVIRGGVASLVPGGPEYTFGFTEYQGKLYFTGDVADSQYPQMFVLETTDDPALASTGADLRMPALIALALLALGAAAVLATRRRARSV